MAILDTSKIEMGMRSIFQYHSSHNSQSRKLSVGVLFLGFVIQLVFLFTSIIGPQVKAVWGVRKLQPLERSAHLSFGDRFSSYISFLQEHVPLDATLVIPRQEGDYVLGHVGIMQYYMIPREIVNCASDAIVEDCIRNLGGTNTYILAVGKFPPQEQALLRKNYVAFDEYRGVYVPRD